MSGRDGLGAAALGAVAGAMLGAVLALVAVLAAGPLFAGEQQQEGTLVVAMLLTAWAGAAAGCAAALRSGRHSRPTRTAAAVLLALPVTVLAVYLVGLLTPAAMLNALGVVLLPAVLVLTLGATAAGARVLTARGARPALRGAG